MYWLLITLQSYSLKHLSGVAWLGAGMVLKKTTFVWYQRLTVSLVFVESALETKEAPRGMALLLLMKDFLLCLIRYKLRPKRKERVSDGTGLLSSVVPQ